MRKPTKRFIGKRFGYLVITGIEHENRRTYAICKCDCGNTAKLFLSNIVSGRQASRGCRRRFMSANGLLHRTHGLSDHRLYDMWKGIIERCYKEKTRFYPWYGGVGIKVCKLWKDDFMNFYRWGMSHGYKDGLYIGRFDTTKDYKPSNCYFGTKKEIMSNRKDNCNITYKGVTKTLSEWARQLHMNVQTLQQRIFLYGWTVEEAIETKVLKNGKKRQKKH